MTPKLPILSARIIMNVLERNGFQRKKKGSGHARYCHKDGRRVTVPFHGKMDIGKGLMVKILKASHKQIVEFLKT
jgi:predicted RNA binding protein YcfA (HicA-like mRNA interferase family)